ncbi:MAG: metal-sensitive transcriptional regulator [Gemmatimonadota bacterium]|nr:metal-sensitive transcriptional regulator [Gemmatimonadota bacterium]
MSPETTSPCACSGRSEDGTHTTPVDPEAKHAILSRLKRIEGQVRGVHKMIEEERYCADVLMQLSSVQEALRGTGRVMLHNHLKHCATEAIVSGDPEKAEAMYDELMELMYKNAR